MNETPVVKVLVIASGKELAEHRRAVANLIEEAGMRPLLPDLEITKNSVAEAYALGAEAHACIGIFGVRYGAVPRVNNSAERSVAELQYRQAMGLGLPMLVSLMASNHAPLGNTAELDPTGENAKYRKRAGLLNEELRRNHPDLLYYSSATDLQTKLSTALETFKVAAAESARRPARTLVTSLEQDLPADDSISKPLLLRYQQGVGLMMEQPGEGDSLDDLLGKPKLRDPLEQPDSGALHVLSTLNAETGFPDADNPGAPAPIIAPPAASPEPAPTLSKPLEWRDCLQPDGLHAPNSAVIPHLPAPPYVPHPVAGHEKFFGRREELTQIGNWAGAPNAPALLLSGAAGTGKTALAWHWFNKVAPGLNFAGMMWWQCSESDATRSQFVRRALAYVTGQSAEAISQISANECEQMLLAALRKRPHLLVLDSAERWLGAYFKLGAPYQPESQIERIEASAPGSPYFRTTDPADGQFLSQLQSCVPSKVMVVSRLHVHPLGDARPIKLGGLPMPDAVALLEGFKLHSGDLAQLSQMYKGVPLLLKLLGAHVTHHYGGDIDAWRALHESHLEHLDFTARRDALFDMILDNLEPTMRKVIELLAVIRHPIQVATLFSASPLLPPIPSKVAEPRRWRSDFIKAKTAYDAYQAAVKSRAEESEQSASRLFEALRGLRSRELVQWDMPTQRLNLHAMVRSEAFNRLTPEARDEAFARSRAFFESLTTENNPRDFADLRAAVEVYNAFIGAGQYDEAGNWYRARLGKLTLSRVATPYQTIELLRPLFPNGPRALPALSTVKSQGFFTNELALMLGYVGQTGEALSLLGLTIGAVLAEEDAPSLCAALIHYAGLLRDAHKMASKVQVFEMARDLANALGDMETLAVSHLFLLKSYVDNGQWEAAEAEYRSFNAIPDTFRTTARQATAERVYAKMLINQGADAAAVLNQAWDLAVRSKSIAEQRAIHALWGEAALQQGSPNAAEKFFQSALDLAPTSGASAANYLGGLARAMVAQGKMSEARAALARGAAPSAAANVYVTMSEKEKARLTALEAYRLAWADGPPYTFWWELTLARRALAALNEPEPTMPPFDPASMPLLPHENDVRSFIRKLQAEKMQG